MCSATLSLPLPRNWSPVRGVRFSIPTSKRKFTTAAKGSRGFLPAPEGIVSMLRRCGGGRARGNVRGATGTEGGPAGVGAVAAAVRATEIQRIGIDGTAAADSGAMVRQLLGAQELQSRIISAAQGVVQRQLHF